jgi:hypothetical protein
VYRRYAHRAPLSRPVTFRAGSDWGLRAGPYRFAQLPLYGDGFILMHQVSKSRRNKLVYRWRPHRWRARSTMRWRREYGLMIGSKPARPGAYKGPRRDPLPNLFYDPAMRDGANW